MPGKPAQTKVADRTWEMVRETVTMPDGRKLNYYTFPKSASPSAEGAERPAAPAKEAIGV